MTDSELSKLLQEGVLKDPAQFLVSRADPDQAKALLPYLRASGKKHKMPIRASQTLSQVATMFDTFVLPRVVLVASLAVGLALTAEDLEFLRSGLSGIAWPTNEEILEARAEIERRSPIPLGSDPILDPSDLVGVNTGANAGSNTVVDSAGESGSNVGASAGVDSGADLGVTSAVNSSEERGVKSGSERGAEESSKTVGSTKSLSGAKNGSRPGSKTRVSSGVGSGDRTDAYHGANNGSTSRAKSGSPSGLDSGTKTSSATGAAGGASLGARSGVKPGSKNDNPHGGSGGAQAGAITGARSGARGGVNLADETLDLVAIAPAIDTMYLSHYSLAYYQNLSEDLLLVSGWRSQVKPSWYHSPGIIGHISALAKRAGTSRAQFAVLLYTVGLQVVAQVRPKWLAPLTPGPLGQIDEVPSVIRRKLSSKELEDYLEDVWHREVLRNALPVSAGFSWARHGKKANCSLPQKLAEIVSQVARERNMEVSSVATLIVLAGLYVLHYQLNPLNP